MTMDNADEEPVTSLPGYDLNIPPFERDLPICAGNTCCHYGEGCALGYPIEWEWLELDRDQFGQQNSREIRLIYSKEFRDYWNEVNGNAKKWQGGLARDPELSEKLVNRRGRAGMPLPCAHKGCSFDKCDLLQEESMMSSFYQKKYMKPSFEAISKQERALKLEKYHAEKERFYGALENLTQLVCPNCQVVREYKVFLPGDYKRGEIICKGCGRSICLLHPL